MFIAKRPRKGRDYYLVGKTIREGKKVRTETKLYIGRIDGLSHNELQTIIAKVDALNDPEVSTKFRNLLISKGYSPYDFVIFERALHFGDVAVFYKIANMLDIPNIIWKNTTKGGGPHIGKIVTTMAIAQALAPTSKNDIRNWYEETALPYISGIEPRHVEEWILYSCMRYLTKDVIENIEADVTKSIVDQFDISLDTCLYDITSTYFYGRKDDMKKHGYNRDHMFHLAQVVIALAVTKDYGLPIKHWVEPGNTTDIQALPKAAREFRSLHKDLSITLVMDRGTLSATNIEILDELNFQYICGLKKSLVVVKDTIRKLRAEDNFEPVKYIKDDEGNDVPLLASSEVRELWGKQRRIVVCYSKPVADTQRNNRDNAIEEAKNALQELKLKADQGFYGHDALVIKIHEIIGGIV